MSDSANFNQVVVRYRGDTKPHPFSRVGLTGLPIDITGRSYRLVVDPSQSPSDNTNNVYELTATLTSPTGGLMEFEFTQQQADAAAGSYYFDVEETDADGDTKTIGGGTWTIKQGIS